MNALWSPNMQLADNIKKVGGWLAQIQQSEQMKRIQTIPLWQWCKSIKTQSIYLSWINTQNERWATYAIKLIKKILSVLLTENTFSYLHHHYTLWMSKYNHVACARKQARMHTHTKLVGLLWTKNWPFAETFPAS